MEAASLSQSSAPRPIAASAKSLTSVALALLAGGVLRIWMFRNFFQTNGDTLVYGGIAKNLLLHGRSELSSSGEAFPTLIRLPGYPFFLAFCFKLFGMENYAAVAWVQIALDLCACLLLADFARRTASIAFKPSAAHATLWLAALCPFTAIYAANPLTEGPTLFSISLALWAAARVQQAPRWSSALAFTFAITFAALLRPDGALVAIALAPAILVTIRGKELARNARIAIISAL